MVIVTKPQIRNCSGMTLFELMLVVILINLIIVVGFIYYDSVQRNKKLNAAIQLIEQLVTIIDNYPHPIQPKIVNGIPTSQAGSEIYTNLSASVVARSGFVPEQFLHDDNDGGQNPQGELNIITPWFTDDYQSFIEIGPGDSDGYQIVLQPIPNYACVALASHLTSLRDTNTQCDAGQYAKITCEEDDDKDNSTLTINGYPAASLYCPDSEDE